MKKKIIGILVCMLLLSMTFSMATAQKMIKEYEKDENQGIASLGNSPPTDPVITGPDTVRKNRGFCIKAVSIDPDGDQIYYRFKFGGIDIPLIWMGPFNSGYEYEPGMLIFGFTGDLTISFQAKDEHDAESGWSYHTVTFTKAKSKPYIHTPFIQFLQNFLNSHPNLFPILQRLLKP